MHDATTTTVQPLIDYFDRLIPLSKEEKELFKAKIYRLRKESPGLYETYADVGLDEWITFGVELEGAKARAYINIEKHPSFVVEKMKGSTTNGSVLWVDIGTIGYFKHLKVTKR